MSNCKHRIVYVHAGIHKTGTTTIQNALASHSDWLAAQNCLFPLAGRPWKIGGHHNIAWELTGDRRFRAEYGTTADLITEIQNGNYDVVLSSEDFTGALADVGSLKVFVRELRNIVDEVHVILFLRNQADYALSLYLELLAHGLADPFDAFLKEAMATGEVRWREWCFPFDFRKCIRNAAQMGGVGVKVRSYDTVKRDSLLSTFLRCCGVEGDPAELISLSRQNPRRPCGESLTSFLQNRCGLTSSEPWLSISEVIKAAFESRSITLASGDRDLILDRFRESNEWVSMNYGVPLNEFMRVSSDVGEYASCTASSLFSREIQELFKAIYGKVTDELNGMVLRQDRLCAGKASLIPEQTRLQRELTIATALIESPNPEH